MDYAALRRVQLHHRKRSAIGEKRHGPHRATRRTRLSLIYKIAIVRRPLGPQHVAAGTRGIGRQKQLILAATIRRLGMKR